MLTRSSAHVHTPYCDGKSDAAHMAETACKLGFFSLGFSSHACQPFDPEYSMSPEYENAYRQEILALKDQYQGRLAIHLGIERDYYSTSSAAHYEYFIASCHYFLKPEGFYAVDGPPEKITQYVERYCANDGIQFAKDYFDLLQSYVLSVRPPIVGHMDLIRKNNQLLHLFDEQSPAYQKMALDCLSALRETNAILEVNTGAMARGYLSTPYPAAFLLKAWHEMKGSVMLNSDCHDARFLAFGYDEAEALLRSCGFTAALRLGRHSLFEEYSLI